MAPYNQQSQNTNAPPGFDSMSHGVFNNGGRGNGNCKKSRDGYKSYRNGSSNGRSPSYGTQKWGPRAMPDVHTGGGNFPPGTPIPWEAQYGGSPSGLWIPLAAGQPEPAGTTGFQFRATSDEYAPPRVPSYVNTPAQHTPIVTPRIPIATPVTQPSATAIVAPMMNGNPPRMSRTDAAKPSSAQNPRTSSASILTSPPPFESLHAPIPTRLQKFRSNVYDSFPMAPDPIIPKEAQTLPIDAQYKNPQGTFDLLDHKALNHLQRLDKRFAAELQETLNKVRTVHHAQAKSSDDQRAGLLSLLMEARDSELAHDKNVRRLNDKFLYKMREACKQGGESKDAAQLEAISLLNAATDESLLARQDRETLEKCRRDLLMLDNERIISANAYANAIHAVVLKGLANQVPRPDPEPIVDIVAARIVKALASVNGEAQENEGGEDEEVPHSYWNSKTHDMVRPSSGIIQETTQQSVIERHPDFDHQSIDEVLDRMIQTEVRVGLKKRDETVSTAAQELTPKYQEKADAGRAEKLENQTSASLPKYPVGSDTVKKAIAVTMSGAPAPTDVNIVELSKQQSQKNSGQVAPQDGPKKDDETKDKATENKDITKSKVENQAPAKSKTTEQSASKAQTCTPATDQGHRRKKNKNKKKGANNGGDGKTNNEISTTAATNNSAAIETH